MSDQLVARPLPARRTTQTQNKRIQISVPPVGFKPRFPVFERAKTVYVLRPCGHCDRHMISYFAKLLYCNAELVQLCLPLILLALFRSQLSYSGLVFVGRHTIGRHISNITPLVSGNVLPTRSSEVARILY
jgi:hypothetical protein